MKNEMGRRGERQEAEDVENLYFISGVPLWIHITASCHFFSSSLHSDSLRFDSSLALPHPKPHDTLMVPIRKLEIRDGIRCAFLTMTQYPSSPLPSSLPKIDDIPAIIAEVISEFRSAIHHTQRYLYLCNMYLFRFSCALPLITKKLQGFWGGGRLGSCCWSGYAI